MGFRIVEVVIREFRTADIDGLFALDYRCYKPPYRFGYQQLLLTLQDKRVSSMVIDNEEEQEIVGGLIVRSDPAGKQVAVVSLMVDREYRRHGLGRRLVAWGEKLARAGEWDALVAPLETGNEVGKTFLAACGFAITAISAPWFNSSSEGRLWRLSLSPIAAVDENTVPDDTTVPGETTAPDETKAPDKIAAPDETTAANETKAADISLPRAEGTERAEEA